MRYRKLRCHSITFAYYKVKYLRSFRLVRAYGDVPFTTEILTEAEANSIKRTSASEIWKIVIKIGIDIIHKSCRTPKIRKNMRIVIIGIFMIISIDLTDPEAMGDNKWPATRSVHIGLSLGL